MPRRKPGPDRLPHPGRTSAELSVSVAEMDPTHADWRAIVLEMAWAGIGGPAT